MLERRESFASRAAHPPRRTFGDGKGGKLGFDLLELAHQQVVFAVGDLGAIENVVASVVAGNQGAELFGAPARVFEPRLGLGRILGVAHAQFQASAARVAQ